MASRRDLSHRDGSGRQCELHSRSAVREGSAARYAGGRSLARREDDVPVVDTVLAGSPVGIAFFDLALRFVRINDALAVVTGRSPREHVGQPLDALWPDMAPALVPVLLRVRETGEPVVNVSVSARTPAHDDPIHWIVRCYPARRRGGTIRGMALAFVQTTEQERMRAALRDTEERLRLLLDGARDHAIYMLDPAGRIVYWSGGAERITGWEEREVVGRHYSLLFSPEDVQRSVPDRELAAAVAEGRVEDARWRPRRDGTTYFADGVLTALRSEDGDLRGFGHVMRDVSDRKSAEEALLQSEARFRFLSEMTLEGVFIHEMGRILDANPAFARMFGYALDDVVGADFMDLLTPASRTLALEHVQAGAEGPYNLTGVRRDGTLIPLEAHARPGTHLGRPVRVAVLRDITERVRAEEALRRSEEKQRRIAETLQRSMLITPPRDLFRGLDVEPLYEAALEEAAVGGDFFDAFPLSDGRVVLVVGDVSGKGLEAAARTSEAKFTLRAFVQELPEPGLALARLNQFLCESALSGASVGSAFIALALAVTDPSTGRTCVSSAGAEPPLLLRADGTAQQVRTTGLPLGIEPGQFYEEECLELGPADTLILTTDGITEARGAGRAFLEYDGFVCLARSARQAPTLYDMGEAILEGARAFSGGSLRDDACLLLARRSFGAALPPTVRN